MPVLCCPDVRSQLFHSEFRLGFTVGMIKDILQLSNDISETLYKSLICFFQLFNGLAFLI